MSWEMKQDVSKVLAGGLLGVLSSGFILFFWFGFSGDYVVMTTVIISVCVAIGVGMGYVLRNHESTVRNQ